MKETEQWPGVSNDNIEGACPWTGCDLLSITPTPSPGLGTLHPPSHLCKWEGGFSPFHGRETDWER